MEPELVVDPEQPDEIVRALEALIVESRPPVDPWWRAGRSELLDVSVRGRRALHLRDVHSLW